jgi:hypothetical protein
MKEEPTHYSFDDLVRDKKTSWTGVRNALAQKHLRSIQKGDRIFFYHGGREIGRRHRKSQRRAVPGSRRFGGQALRSRRRAGETAEGTGDARRHQSRQVLRRVPARADGQVIGHAGDG